MTKTRRNHTPGFTVQVALAANWSDKTLEELDGYFDVQSTQILEWTQQLTARAFGQRAKQNASDLALGKEITLQTHGHDKYRRTLGDVILHDGTNINHTVVKAEGAG